MWDRWVPTASAKGFLVSDLLNEKVAERQFKEALYVTHASEKLKWSFEQLRVRPLPPPPLPAAFALSSSLSFPPPLSPPPLSFLTVFGSLASPFWSLQDASEAVGAGLLEMGYKRGAKVAVWAGNEAEAVTTFLGAASTGNQVVAVDPNVSTEGVATILRAENARGLFFTQRWGSEHRPALLNKIVPDLADTRNEGRVVQSKEMRELRHLVNLGHDRLNGMMNFHQVPVYNPLPNPVEQVRPYLSEDAPVFVSYRAAAGGGAVKGSAYSTKDAFGMARAAGRSLGLTASDTVIVTAPIHTGVSLFGGVLGAITHNAKVCLVNRAFNADEVLDAMTKQRATVLVATSEQLQALTEGFKADAAKSLPKYNLSFLRTGLIDTSYGGKGSLSISSASLLAVDSSKDKTL